MVTIMPAAIPIEVTSEQQRELQRIVTAKTSSQRDVFRARIILGLAEGDLLVPVREGLSCWTASNTLHMQASP
jgi:hypothetical protein